MGLGAPPVTHNVTQVLCDGGQSNTAPEDTLPSGNKRWANITSAFL